MRHAERDGKRCGRGDGGCGRRCGMKRLVQRLLVAKWERWVIVLLLAACGRLSCLLERARLPERQREEDRRPMQELLARPLKDAQFEKAGLGQVIRRLADEGGINIYVNWRALEAAGIDQNTPVSFHV